MIDSILQLLGGLFMVGFFLSTGYPTTTKIERWAVKSFYTAVWFLGAINVIFGLEGIADAIS